MKVLSTTGVQSDYRVWPSAYSVVPSGYSFGAGETDVTSVATLKEMLRLGRCDYKRFRTGLTLYVEGVGFANLSASDKLEAARNFVVSESDRLTVLTRVEMAAAGSDFHSRSCACRTDRLHKAEAIIYSYFSTADTNALIDAVAATGVRERYVQFGIEVLADGDDGLYDWVQATAGTAYATTGLAALSYTPLEGTMASVVTRIMEILTTGQ